MDYNNILNNKRKMKEIKDKTMGVINKATEKMTGITSNAVDTVVDTVKSRGNQTSKVSVFANVISVIDTELINATLTDKNAALNIVEYKVEQDGVMSIEGILEGITASYDEPLKAALNSSDYIEALFSLVAAHYNHETGIKYSLDKRVMTVAIIPVAEKSTEKVAEECVMEEVVVEETSNNEEVKCDCEEPCEACSCKEAESVE